MCWAGQEYPTTSSSNHAGMMKQPVIFINKTKAMTEPGTIWLLTGSGPNNWNISAQNVDFRTEMNGKYIGYEQDKRPLFLTHHGSQIYPNREFSFKWPTDNTNNLVYIKVNGGEAELATETYLQTKGSSTSDGYLNVGSGKNGLSTDPTCEFYFEEVDGSTDAYLGFPPVNLSYNISGTVLNVNGGTCSTYDGSGTYQITDKQTAKDEDETVWYYATMCLPFPVVVPDEILCYFVDENMNAIPIEYSNENTNGGHRPKTVKVIPKGIPFVARMKSTENNKGFVPYIVSSNPADPDNLGVNALKKAQKSQTTINYLVDDASNNNTTNLYKLSGLTNDGKLKFETQISSSEKVDGNRAFFGTQAVITVPEPAEVDLADLIYETEDGNAKWTESDYVKIKDNLTVCYVNQNSGLVFARDDQNNKNYWSKVEGTPSNYYHFDPENENGVQQLLLPSNYNQSNWVIIRGSNYDFKVGQTIKGKTLKGFIESDKSHPSFVALDYLADDSQSNNQTVTLNTYSVAHLMADENHELESGIEGKGKYFFMTPKPAEVANVTWAILKKVDGNVYAYIPARDDNNNALDFHGRVLLNPEMYAGAISDWSEDKLNEMLTAIDGKGICFKAVILPVSEESSGSNAPRRASVVESDPVSEYYVVYPLEFQVDSNGNPIVTSVKGVTTTATVKSVRFYNLQGIESYVPFDGINIVVERYDDGSVRSSKMLF